MSDIRSASDQRYIYFPHLDFFYCDSHSLFPFLSIHGNMVMFDWQVCKGVNKRAFIKRGVTMNCSMRYEPQMYERSKKRNTDFV